MRFSRYLTLALVITFAAGAVACGDDPVSHSEPVGIHLSFGSGDVAGGRVGDDKNINTESGNPYAAFVAAARDALGRDPGNIEVEGVTLTLLPTSTGVAGLGEIYDGPTGLSFEMNGTGTIVPVASLDIGPATMAGPITMVVGFAPSTIVGDDWTSLVGGNFKVAIDGPAQGDFENAGASVDLEATFTFTAYE